MNASLNKKLNIRNYFLLSVINLHYLMNKYMNQSDSEGSSIDQNGSKQIQRLHAIWKNVKQTKNKQKNKSHIDSAKKSIGSVKQAIHHQEQKNLQARLAMTQKQLSKSRENTALLMKKLGQAQQQIEYLTVQVEKQKKQKQQYINEAQELRYQLSQQQKQRTFGNEKFSNNNPNTQEQINNLKKQIQNKQKQIDRYALKVKSLQLDKKNHQSEVKTLVDLNQDYRKQVLQAENAMNQFYLGEASKGAQLLQLDQANKTIQRLVQLLKSTEQYYNLADFAEDVQQLHFLKNIPKRLKTNVLNHQPPERRKLCTCMDIKIDQRLLWTSAACYKALLDMKIKYDSLTEDCIEQVLFQLNKVWLARQQSHVKKVRQSYEFQISRLKKKGQIRYDQMVARKQIQRLKKQLNGARYSKKNSSATGMNMDSLKSMGQYEDQLRLKQRQIRLLQQRIKLIETQTNSNDKVLYMEGALWIIDKVITQLQANQQDLRQFQVRFRQKMDQNTSQQDWIRSYKQFFQNTTQIQNLLLQKLFVMKQSTLKKMGIQKNNIRTNILADANRKY